MAEPLISRTFGRFLISLGSLVTSVPFVDRNDWRGWLASFVIAVSLATILVLVVLAAVDRIRDWRDGDF